MKRNIILFLLALTFLGNSEILIGQTIFIEAESSNNELLGDATLRNCPGCSAGNRVGALGAANGGVLFKNITIDKTGPYVLKVYYTAGAKWNFFVTVNNQPPRELACESTGDWNVAGIVEMLVHLNKGKNTLKFDNPETYAPDLDKISLQYTPDIPGFQISGVINDASGNPVCGLSVKLTGDFNLYAKTNNLGAYKIDNVPRGSYSVTPEQGPYSVSPAFHYYSDLLKNSEKEDFLIKNLKPASDTLISVGSWQMNYDLNNGLADLIYDRKPVLTKAYSLVNTPSIIRSNDFLNYELTVDDIHDGFGDGRKVSVTRWNTGSDTMVQHFSFYPDQPFFLSDVALINAKGISSNYMAPLVCDIMPVFLPEGDCRILSVPYDNDAWVRYNAAAFANDVTSYEVCAIYNNDTREGLIAGSIEHDVWKTAIQFDGVNADFKTFRIFGGASSSGTRDVLAHGAIKGDTLSSPVIFIGFFKDWRDGLEKFAEANTIVQPGLTWNKPVPFGWNSWGKIQSTLSYTKAIEVSDFFKNKVPEFQNEGVTYIGLDAYWNSLSDIELKQFAEHCEANGQHAGIYWTPFIDWSWSDGNRMVEGTSYKYKEVYLYANGEAISLDGAYALDPTHPATKKRIDIFADRFKKAGFKYIKLDFLTHGALEGDAHFNQQTVTGTQAYNEGMSYLLEKLGDDFFINESISPLFPFHYAHGRRMACDAYGAIGETAYTLNSLNYGWWLSGLYCFNDADNVVLEGFSEGENRARVTSSVVTGIFIAGDDVSASGSQTAKDKVRKFLTNAEVNSIGTIGKPFRPVEGNTGTATNNLFIFDTPDSAYLAVINYQAQDMDFDLPLSRLGWNLTDSIYAKELWEGKIKKVFGNQKFRVKKKDAVIFKYKKDGGRFPGQIEEPLGTGKIDHSKFKSFPNPANKLFTIESPETIATLSIYSSQGRLLLCNKNINSANYDLDVEHLSSGIYTVLVFGRNGATNTTRFLKIN